MEASNSSSSNSSQATAATQRQEDTIDAIAAAATDINPEDEDGPAFASYFRELQLDLTKQMHERPSKLPKCYDEGTFWITPPNAFFSLWRKNCPDPQPLRRPRVFVWLVHLLVDVLHCPACDNKKLQSHGWATAPCARRILDLNSDFYLMSYRYKCPNCKKTYFGHDQAIRDTLPTALAEEFPAVLSHRSGISRSTLDLMQSCSSSAIGPFTRIIKEHHALRSARLKLQYLAAKKETAESNADGSTMTALTTAAAAAAAAATATVPQAPAKKRRTSPVVVPRPSAPLPIAPRPPQPTPVFLPQPIFAMHPHIIALQQQQQQQAGNAVPQPIPLQPIFYIQHEATRPPPPPPIHVPKKPRKPRTILKKPN
ncbi:hypothetical protein BJV82DRAFT_599948 [Fennellomyces sp. T-0311]|nr:hypothetical protein BJV82DRAFT_599948 [Fennellomyces sp. T-0311]